MDATLLRSLVSSGYIPVVATVATDESGQALNVNADTAAGEIAAALQAEKLILMTDVPGVLRDKDDVSTKFAELNIKRSRELMQEGIIAGGMIPKVIGWAGGGWGGGLGDRVHLGIPPGTCRAALTGGTQVWRPLSGVAPQVEAGFCTAGCGAGCPCLCSPSANRKQHQVQCCVRCISQGVNATHIIDGRSRHSILMELLTDEGVGTMITG